MTGVLIGGQAHMFFFCSSGVKPVRAAVFSVIFQALF
jgi:hypothetical protein